MNPVRRYIDARTRARAIVAAATHEALLIGDYTDIHPAVTDGAVLRIVGENDQEVAAECDAIPDTTILMGHHQVIRLDTVNARPYDHQRDGL